MSKNLDKDIGITIERLKQVFERSSDLQAPDVQEAVAQIIEEANVVDTTQPEGSPRRNVPLWMALGR